VEALTATGRPYDLIDVSNTDHDYFDLLSGLWAERRDFLIVEHDMVPEPDMVEMMAFCSGWWCVNPYESNAWGQRAERAFGFTRFRAELMAAEPDAFSATVKYRHLQVLGRRWPEHHWRGLDCRFDCVMGDRRLYRAHVHEPSIQHLHHWADYPPVSH
jgi:hypothetical protein